MGKLVDLAGKVFSRLTVLERRPNTVHKKAVWLCQCECGTQLEVIGSSLQNGRTKSCGCLNAETSREWMTNYIKDFPYKGTHRKTGTKEYWTWAAMVQRCTNPNNKSYCNYGGRGIRICDQWLSFDQFIKDMGEKPSPELTIERIDNDGPYSPENCCWANRKAQANNSRNNRYISIGDQRKTISQWAESVNMKLTTLWGRLENGMTLEEALAIPVNYTLALAYRLGQNSQP